MQDKRLSRINSEVMKALSELILSGLKDPRIPSMTSVTEVRVSKDLMFVDIYISVMGSDSEKQDALAALDSSKGYIRTFITQKVGLRLAPMPRFHLDESIEKGVRLNKLIDEVVQSDEERKNNE